MKRKQKSLLFIYIWIIFFAEDYHQGNKRLNPYFISFINETKITSRVKFRLLTLKDIPSWQVFWSKKL